MQNTRKFQDLKMLHRQNQVLLESSVSFFRRSELRDDQVRQ